MSKRKKGFPSETHVKRGLRTVHGDKLLEEKLGRNMIRHFHIAASEVPATQRLVEQLEAELEEWIREIAVPCLARTDHEKDPP